jgi:chromate reductase
VNRRLLRSTAERAPQGVAFEHWDGLSRIPPFDEDDEAAPGPEVAAFRQALADADAVLFATPEYNGSIPGALKNALDWASRPTGASPLAGKPVAVIGASASPHGGVWAQADLRKVLGIAGASVVERGAALGRAASQFSADGALLDETVCADVEATVADLLQTVTAQGR